jgi:hypothetical protein
VKQCTRSLSVLTVAGEFLPGNGEIADAFNLYGF